MADPEKTNPPNKPRRSLRGVRPILWWLLFVLVLYGVRKHQEWIERTRLSFSVTLERQPVGLEGFSKLDGRAVMSGERLSLGSHTFTITHPKAEPFSTNLFIWYGEHNLGAIALKRAKGTLVIQSRPLAAVLSVSGPEFAVTLTNSLGMTSSVPTDSYVVEAKYPHSRESAQVSVLSGAVASWHFTPRLGSLSLTCNQPDALFQLLTLNEQSVETGKLPVTIPDLPEGRYKLLVWHHDIRREERIAITAGRTNDMDIRFVYGSALIQTEPPGAEVTGSGGHYWGMTPLQLTELQLGSWKFVLRRNGYESVSAPLEITGGATNTFTTNLVNVNYSKAMSAARQYLAASDYSRSLESATIALEAKPNDPDAILLQKQASTGASLQLAERLGKEGDFAAGIKELKSLLKAVPENDDATRMLADFERQKESIEEQRAKRQQELAEKQRVERSAQPKKVYDSCAAKLTDGELFDTHVLTTSKALNDVQEGIIHELRDVQPGFKVFPYDPPAPETFKIIAEQEYSGGFRRCLIVGGQSTDDEVKIFFKVLEFKLEHRVRSVEQIPVHPTRIKEMTDELKVQVRGGVQLVTDRIKWALDETAMRK